MNDDVALTIAAKFIKAEEGCFLVAYPDPLSPLAKALGPSRVAAIGRGAGVPADYRHLKGDPWTIGYGATGPDIRHGTVWSQQHADARLAHRLAADLAKVKTTWPGAHRLHAKALAAMVSLVYNRGDSLTKRAGDPLDRRREMRELRPAIVQRDYLEMARLFRSMKRLWQGMGVAGLLRRREAEAVMCEEAHADTAERGRA
jgi:lysozyme